MKQVSLYLKMTLMMLINIQNVHQMKNILYLKKLRIKNKAIIISKNFSKMITLIIFNKHKIKKKIKIHFYKYKKEKLVKNNYLKKLV
jgi:hypothetical protein